MHRRAIPGRRVARRRLRAVFHGQKSYNGVAILAKEEPRAVRMGFCDEVEDDQGARHCRQCGRPARYLDLCA